MRTYKRERNGFGDIIPTALECQQTSRRCDDWLAERGQPSGNWHHQIKSDFKSACQKAYWAQMNKGAA